MLPTGHKDSVTCAVFSHDSSLVATADMSGLIKVWKVENKEEIWSFEVGDLEVRECVCLCICEQFLQEFMRKLEDVPNGRGILEETQLQNQFNQV